MTYRHTKYPCRKCIAEGKATDTFEFKILRYNLEIDLELQRYLQEDYQVAQVLGK